MPTLPCCEYYGRLPKLIRKSAAQASISGAPLPLATGCSPHGLATDGAAVPRAEGSTAVPSTYTLTKPLTCRIAMLPPKPQSSLRVVVVSDTHERHREMTVPHGDVLIHCGDIQEGFAVCRNVDTMLVEFSAWFNDPILHPHPVKVIIAGNHDKAIAGMNVEAVRKLFAPALYLCDESAVIEPHGLRIYGSPRSISNSRCSPNTAFQSSKWWTPFMFPTTREVPTSTEGGPAEHRSYEPLHVRLEGKTPLGPIDILVAHQSPDTPHAHHSVEEQPIATYVQQVAPRRALLCGHLHGAHGMHRLPTPLAVGESFGLTADDGAPNGGQGGLLEIPFLPCINAAMMMGLIGPVKLLPASVVDLEL